MSYRLSVGLLALLALCEIARAQTVVNLHPPIHFSRLGTEIAPAYIDGKQPKEIALYSAVACAGDVDYQINPDVLLEAALHRLAVQPSEPVLYTAQAAKDSNLVAKVMSAAMFGGRVFLLVQGFGVVQMAAREAALVGLVTAGLPLLESRREEMTRLDVPADFYKAGERDVTLPPRTCLTRIFPAVGTGMPDRFDEEPWNQPKMDIPPPAPDAIEPMLLDLQSRVQTLQTTQPSVEGLESFVQRLWEQMQTVASQQSQMASQQADIQQQIADVQKRLP